MDGSYTVKAAGLNGDGWIDLAVANDNTPHKLFFGNEKGGFVPAGTFGTVSPTRNLEIVDIDLDGDMDLIVSNRKRANEIRLRKDDTYCIVIGDLNQDGFPDIVEANSDAENLYYFTTGKK